MRDIVNAEKVISDENLSDMNQPLIPTVFDASKGKKEISLSDKEDCSKWVTELKAEL